MDVVFILIFFLLASAHFLKVFEIGSDLPIFKIADEEDIEKNKFELRAKILKDEVILLNGIDKKAIVSIKIDDGEFEEKLRTVLLELKQEHPKKNRVVMNPDSKIDYQALVRLMDIFRSHYIDGKEENLFNQIMFEKTET
jgi:biopolymer transport protein ExbD